MAGKYSQAIYYKLLGENSARQGHFVEDLRIACIAQSTNLKDALQTVLTVVAEGCAAVPAANTRTEIRQHGGGIDTGGAGNTADRRKQDQNTDRKLGSSSNTPAASHKKKGCCC